MLGEECDIIGCSGCGLAFERQSVKRRRCDRCCVHSGAPKAAEIITKRCGCGAEFSFNATGRMGRHPIHCSDKCRRAAARSHSKSHRLSKGIPCTCRVCGLEWRNTETNAKRTICSDRCRKLMYKGQRHTVWREAVCLASDCATPFRTAISNQVYCSERCQRRERSRRARKEGRRKHFTRPNKAADDKQIQELRAQMLEWRKIEGTKGCREAMADV